MKWNKKRWRAAGAAVGSGTVGAAAGYVAASCGMDPGSACNLGWSAALAAGRSVLPLLRNRHNEISATAPEESLAGTRGAPPLPPLRTAPRNYTEFSVPLARMPRHSGHRRLKRAALRSAERIRQHSGEDGHGAA